MSLLKVTSPTQTQYTIKRMYPIEMSYSILVCSKIIIYIGEKLKSLIQHLKTDILNDL